MLMALFTKLMVYGFSISDCLGALVILVFAYGIKVLDYYVPKRPDIYTDLESLQATIKGLVSTTDDLKRDVMGLKLGGR